MIEPPEDLGGASEHLWISCPHCHRSNLRIRRVHLGRRVYCKHCGHHFRARSGQDPGAIATSTRPAPGESPASDPAEADQAREAMGESKLQRIRAAMADQAIRCDTALRQLAASQDQLAETQGRLHHLQEQLDRLQGQPQQEEGLRDELEGLRSENDRLRAAAEELRSQATDAAHLEGILRAELQATRTQVGRIDLWTVEATAHELEDVRAERDRLRAELEEREADRLRFTELADELETLRADRDRLDAAVRAGVAREERLQARIHEVERRAGEERDQAEGRLQVWQERFDAARLQLERDVPPLRAEAERLRHRIETLGRERDIALRQVEALRPDRDRLAVLLEQVEAAGREAARHEAEAHRLARTIEQDRDQLAAMARRDEELVEQARGLQSELDRLRRDRQDEEREHRRSLESLRHDLEIARSEATAARDHVAAAAETRAELEGRLAEVEDRLRAANEQARRLEGETRARRDRGAAPQAESQPGRSLAEGDRETDRLRIEQLTADLDEARSANERLRSLLSVFGLVDHLGSGAGPPPERAPSPGVLPGRQQPPAPVEGSGPR